VKGGVEGWKSVTCDQSRKVLGEYSIPTLCVIGTSVASLMNESGVEEAI